MKINISNPIYYELKKYKLISKKNLIKISSKTRDKKISVFGDKKTKLIFLEKYITSIHYYTAVKNLDDTPKAKTKAKRKTSYVKTFKGYIKTPILEDDLRRSQQFKKILQNKDILDFGSGF